jgi:hypothetical protein
MERGVNLLIDVDHAHQIRPKYLRIYARVMHAEMPNTDHSNSHVIHEKSALLRVPV